MGSMKYFVAWIEAVAILLHICDGRAGGHVLGVDDYSVVCAEQVQLCVGRR